MNAPSTLPRPLLPLLSLLALVLGAHAAARVPLVFGRPALALAPVPAGRTPAGVAGGRRALERAAFAAG